MPEGVEVLVEDGYAIIDFVDPKAKGPGLAALVEVGGPSCVVKDSRRQIPGQRHHYSHQRAVYQVPESIARAAGLLDAQSEVEALQLPDNLIPHTPSAVEIGGRNAR